ncbi:aldose epimerase family protein [Megalodesulfovibrio paquesii]
MTFPQLSEPIEVVGTLLDGRPVHRHVLANAAGVEVAILEYGAALERLVWPDRAGHRANVLAGPDTLPARLQDPRHCGALLGRFAGCIAGARYELEGAPVQLTANCGPHHCDGGAAGLHSVLWSARREATATGMSVVLSYISQDGEEGYPGTLGVQARYVLTDDNLLYVEMLATSTADTICNLSQQCSYNLAGAHLPHELAAHELEVLASYMLPEAHGLPVAQPRLAHGTAADLRMPVRLGDRLAAGDGLDCFLVLPGCIECPELVARLRHPPSGRGLELYSTRPGLRVRTMEAGANTPPGLVLADMHLPDSPNQPRFPNVWLFPGGVYRHMTVLRLL